MQEATTPSFERLCKEHFAKSPWSAQSTWEGMTEQGRQMFSWGVLSVIVGTKVDVYDRDAVRAAAIERVRDLEADGSTATDAEIEAAVDFAMANISRWPARPLAA
jgi:hypothetical protein